MPCCFALLTIETRSCRAPNYSSFINTFLYIHCADLRAARSFYTDVLGLTEIYFSSEDRTVGYQVGALQITIAVHDRAAYVDGWAKQLGWEGGLTSTPSWGVEVTASSFRGVVEAARITRVHTRHPEPVWVGYWSFPVRDPMGYTVEITTPNRDAWPPSS